MRVLYTASRKASRVRRERLGAAGPRGHGAVSRGFNSPWVGEEPLESSFTSGNCRGIGVGPRKCWALRGWGNFNTTFEKSLNHLNSSKEAFRCHCWAALLVNAGGGLRHFTSHLIPTKTSEKIHIGATFHATCT